MMMNPNILNQNPLMFFDRAVNAQRSQLLTVMAEAVSECRTAADQAAELNETGQVGLIRRRRICLVTIQKAKNEELVGDKSTHEIFAEYKERVIQRRLIYMPLLLLMG